jgi:hypothetical protein
MLYICNMKFLFIFLTSTFICHGQRLSSDDIMLNRVAKDNVNTILSIDYKPKGRVKELRPSSWVKFTMKTWVNSRTTTKVMNTGRLEIDDYLSLGCYDIRMKIYLSNNLRIINGVVVTGFNTNMVNYSTGLILKF